jgi:hypothetical protein
VSCIERGLSPTSEFLDRRAAARTLLGGLVGSSTLLGSAWLAGCSSPPPASPVAAAPAPAPAPVVPTVAPAKTWAEYHKRAARKLVEANAGKVYLGPVPEPLLAVPVIEIELKADGSVAKINVMRKPSQAHDTVELAIAAIHRAAPFGEVSHLPKPWKYTEVFLFNDQRLFKPRTLDT